MTAPSGPTPQGQPAFSFALVDGDVHLFSSHVRGPVFSAPAAAALSLFRAIADAALQQGPGGEQPVASDARITAPRRPVSSTDPLPPSDRDGFTEVQGTGTRRTVTVETWPDRRVALTETVAPPGAAVSAQLVLLKPAEAELVGRLILERGERGLAEGGRR